MHLLLYPAGTVEVFIVESGLMTVGIVINARMTAITCHACRVLLVQENLKVVGFLVLG